MNAKLSSLLRPAGLVGALFLLPGLRAADTDTLPVFDTNYIKVSAAGSAFNEGAKAAAQRRLQTPTMGAGGIEAFSYTKEVSKETSWQVDGKALGYAGDYLAQFKVTKNEVGSFEAGYKRFRTFYDGAGGFFPINNAWLPLNPRATYVDRGNLFFNATIELPKAPVYTFRYSNQTRTGRKDSTILGETDATGIPIWSLGTLNPVPAARKILPAYLDLNERQESFEASARQTFGKTTASLSLIGTRINNRDTRSEVRYAGELKPFPAIPANPPTLVPPLLANNQIAGFDRQGLDEKGWTLLTHVETPVNDALSVYGNASYHHASGDLAGERLMTASIAAVTGRQDLVGGFAPGGRPPYSYTSAGDIKLDIYTANAGVQLKAAKDLRVDLGLRAEDYTAIGHNRVNYIDNQVTLSTGTVVPMPVFANNTSRNSERVWSPQVDARYGGIRNVTLFGSWDYRSSPGDEQSNYGSLNVNTTAGTVSPGTATFNDKVKERHSDAKVGGNWAPNTALTLRAEFFTKDHQNRFDGYGASVGNLYILDYDITGVKTTALVRVTPTLSLTTRYVTQQGKAAVADERFAKGTSGASRRHQLGESVNWNPGKTWFVQANANVVYDQIKTAYPVVTGIARDALRNADSNYWNGSLITGFAIDKVTNGQIEGTYYKADNYNRALASTGMTYGAGGREYGLNFGLTRKFSDRWLASAKVGYFESRNDTTGGFTNFRGPLAYVAIQHGL